MTRSVAVLAGNHTAQAQAKRVAAELAALGFAVDPVLDPALKRQQAARLERARKVVLVWSRAARGTPALRAAARRARANGKLVCVTVDAAPPPVGGRAVALPRDRAAWRRILNAKKKTQPTPKPVKPAPRPKRARPRAERTPSPPASQAAVAAAPKTAPRRSSGASAIRVLTALALVTLAAGSETYVRDAGFAARVDAMMRTAQARAADFVDAIARGG